MYARQVKADRVIEWLSCGAANNANVLFHGGGLPSYR